MTNITTGIILDTRRERQDNTFPVKLRITVNRKRHYYNIGHFFTKDEFQKIMSERPRGKFKDYRIALNKIEIDAETLINSMDVFSFEKFKRQYFEKVDYTDLFKTLEYWVKEYKENGRPSTASTYSNTLNSWQKFYKKERLPFTEVTPKLLAEYESSMRKQGKSVSTIGIYLRNVRRVYNLAIESGKIKQEYYPFGSKERGLYKIPESRNIKRALSKEQIKSIVKYKADKGSPEEYYRDIWFFSYLCNGINIADIARLKYKNIDSETIFFIRKKTSTNRNITPVIVENTDETKQILNKWGARIITPDQFVFKIIHKNMTPERELASIKQFTKLLNKYVDRIATKVGIEQKVTSYTARHSFATVLKLSGENILYISEALGHKNITTTENYLKSFDRDTRREAAKKLTDW